MRDNNSWIINLLFMQKVAIIIPCYNEEYRLDEKNIDFLIKHSDVVVYFANDGSTDNTSVLIEQIANKYNQRCFVVNYEYNEGKSNTIFKTIHLINKENKFDYIGYFDADFSTPYKEIVRILKELENRNHTLIFGSRILLLNTRIKRKWQRHIIGRVIVTLINLKFKLGIYDTQCGAKIFSKDLINVAFSKPFQTSWLFDVEVFIRLKKQNLLSNACEFPLQEWQDIEGSKLSWKTSFKILNELYILVKKY